MDKHKQTSDYEEFARIVGLIEEDELEALGWPIDNGNRICFSQTQKLLDFIKKLNAKPDGKKYHIATHVDGDADYVVVNRMAYVNRVDYFLCDGSDDPDITLSEDDVFDD